MKSVIFKFSGKGSDGATITLNAASRRGGQSCARYMTHGASAIPYLDENGEAKKRVIEADTPDEMAAGLAMAINLSGEFAQTHIQAASRAGMLILSCSEVYDDCRFWVEAQGGKNTEVIEEV